MAIETKEKEIDGLTFEVTQLGYFRAQRLLAKLLRLGGATLVGLAAAYGRGDEEGKSTVREILREATDLAPLLVYFFDRLDPDAVEALSKEILDTTRVKQGEKWVKLVPVMDMVIGSAIITGLKVQGFALSVIFGNFSDALGALGLLGPGAKASRSSESSTSTDSRGGNS